MYLKICLGAAIAAALCAPAYAHEDEEKSPRAMEHAPIGVMGDHRHKKGEWMASYRFMRMDMDGVRDGTDSLTPDQVATSVPHRFFGNSGQPPTLRVVPTQMTMDMHMVGGMYGLSDRVTLMGMVNFLSNDMDHITYMGGMGTNVLGGFSTSSEGIGDTSVTAIIGLDDGSRAGRQINLNLGLSLPTGSIEETAQILTPMGMTPSPRMPYAMQLGSGTFDVKPALTYQERSGRLGWGAQASAVIRLDENDEGYTLGDRFAATGWIAYEVESWISLSARLKASSVGQIEGMDPAIMAPVQTADPDNYGGETVEALFGVNLVGQEGALRGHRLAAEVGLPLYRDLNGPQLETDATFTIGWQKAW